MNCSKTGRSTEAGTDPSQSSSKPPGTGQLVCHEALDRKTFLRDHMKTGKPLILTGVLKPWYQSDVWNFEWFRDHYHDLKVRLRFPSSHKSESKTGFDIEYGTLGNYLENLLARKQVSECGYLASLPLQRLPALQHLAVFPDYRWINRFSAAAAWLGPEGTESVLHCDLLDNMLAQVRGRKMFQLYPPDAIDSSEPRLNNSLVAALHYRKSPPEPEYEFVLEAGQILYIPPNYWHRVISLEPSISVNLSWYTPQTTLRDTPRILTALARASIRRLRRMFRP